MKRIKCNLKLTFIVACLAVKWVTASPCLANDIRLNVKADKDVFLLGEPIWIDIDFFNGSSNTLSLDCVELCWLRLRVHVFNSDGDTLGYCGYIADGVCEGGPAVKPGGTYNSYLNVSENFGKGAEQYLPPPLRYLEKGTYTLGITYAGVSSNLITFDVESPTGGEKLAHDLIAEASRPGFEYYHSAVPEVVELFQGLVAKYPKSVYADLAHYELAGLYGLLGQTNKTRDQLKELVLEYPNSHFVLKALPDLLQQMSDDEKAQFLKYVIKKLPGTRAFRVANKALQESEQPDKSKQ